MAEQLAGRSGPDMYGWAEGSTAAPPAARTVSPPPRARRRGRRPAGENTRQTILTAAQKLFLAEGYDQVSIRGVAREARVDPALVHHYFDGKADLFVASVVVKDVNPAQQLDGIVTGDPSTMGERVVVSFLDVWERPEARDGFTTVLRVAMHPETGMRPFREFLVAEVLRRLPIACDDPDEASRRAQLMASQLLGMALARYVLQLPAFADASPAELVEMVGPALQRHIDGQ